MKMASNGRAKIEYVALSDLKGATRNPKGHDLGAIHQSIARFGFTAPLLIDERTGRLVAGHGRLAILHQMMKDGDSPPARIVEKAGDWMVPIVRGVGFDSDDDAEAYLIADNRLTELGGWDDAVLLEALQDLAKNDALDGSGYDGDDIDALIAQLETELWTTGRASAGSGSGSEACERTRERRRSVCWSSDCGSYYLPMIPINVLRAVVKQLLAVATSFSSGASPMCANSVFLLRRSWSVFNCPCTP